MLNALHTEFTSETHKGHESVLFKKKINKTQEKKGRIKYEHMASMGFCSLQHMCSCPDVLLYAVAA